MGLPKPQRTLSLPLQEREMLKKVTNLWIFFHPSPSSLQIQDCSQTCEYVPTPSSSSPQTQDCSQRFGFWQEPEDTFVLPPSDSTIFTWHKLFNLASKVWSCLNIISQILHSMLEDPDCFSLLREDRLSQADIEILEDDTPFKYFKMLAKPFKCPVVHDLSLLRQYSFNDHFLL